MEAYKQTDVQWSSIQLGTCNTTIGASGCFITCLGMLAEITPDRVNLLLKSKGGFSNGCLVNDNAASILGLEYSGRTNQDPHDVCIGETHYFAPKVPQHFVVMLGHDNLILDPLDGRQKTNPYPIVSYRLYHPKQEPMPTPPTPPDEFSTLKNGDLIKAPNTAEVSLFNDGKRYVFPDGDTFLFYYGSWKNTDGSDKVKTVGQNTYYKVGNTAFIRKPK